MQSERASSVVGDPPSRPSTVAIYGNRRVAWYSVCVFSLINALDYIDRGTINLLIQPIKRDLHLSDLQVSLLVGLAYSTLYALVGLPMSRLADRGPRKWILTAGITVWSSATALAAFMNSFAGLFLCRGLVGAGESVKGPNALSMIADLIPRDRMARAMAIYTFGITLGSAASMIIGGLLLAHLAGRELHVLGATLHDWQAVLLICGVPGLAIAALVALTVPEPPRLGLNRKKGMPISEVIGHLREHRAVFLPLLLGAAIVQIEYIGLQSWSVAFYERTFGWKPARIAPMLGTISLFVAPLGLFAGAWLGERMARRGDPGAMARLASFGYVGMLPFTVLSPLMPSPWLSLSCSIAAMVCYSLATPGFNAAIQIVTPNAMRGQINALYLFTISVIGTTVGPLIVAGLTDFVFRDESKLRFAMALTAAVFGTLATLLSLRAVGPFRQRMTDIIAQEAIERHG